MRKALFMTAIVLLASGHGAEAESFRARFNHANALLRSGDTQTALSRYKDLQIEEPESDKLYYNIGCAQYEEGRKHVEGNDPDAAQASFREAIASFEQALHSPDARIRRDAAYNAANAQAQSALAALQSRPREGIDGIKNAIEGYERFLERYPDHQGARDNLDHMRYTLKQLLQEAQKQPEQQKDRQQQGGQQDKDNQNGQQGQQDEPQQAQAAQSAGSEGEQDQQKDEAEEKELETARQQQSEQDKAKQNEDKDKEAQQQTAGEQKESPQKAAEAQTAPEQSAAPRDKQTVDALLQSIEDQDKREQRNLRDDQNNIRAPKEWW